MSTVKNKVCVAHILQYAIILYASGKYESVRGNAQAGSGRYSACPLMPRRQFHMTLLSIRIGDGSVPFDCCCPDNIECIHEGESINKQANVFLLPKKQRVSYFIITHDFGK